MHPLSAAAILEKNRLVSDGAWLLMLEVTFLSGVVVRVCRNTEAVEWGGHTWHAMVFEIDTMREARGENPGFQVRISNKSGQMAAYMANGNGGIGAGVKIIITNSKLIATNPDPEIIYPTKVIGADVNNEWASFSLGGLDPFRHLVPANAVRKSICRWKSFKGPECRYSGSETTCDRTLARCRVLNNSRRFGGFPSVGPGSVIA